MIPRYTAKVTPQTAGTVNGALHQLADHFDRNVRTLDKQLRGQAWTPAGREFAIAQARQAFEADTQATVDQLTKGTRDHAAQLRAELERVPEPQNWFAVQRIWQRLDAMSDAEADAFMRQTTDPMIVAAVAHAGPFSFGSEAARRIMLTNFAKTHKAEKFALLQDAEAFMEIVAEFRDALLRRYREIR